MNCLSMIVIALLSFAATSFEVVEKKFDPCSLLTNNEIQAVQGHAPAQKVSSEQPARSFQFTQCFYRTPEFTSSVSVAVGVPLPTDSKRSGPREYWQQQFHAREDDAAETEEKKPPKRIAGLGDEAFWVGDPLSGALYVLKGEVFLRLSVGGPPDQTEKIKRAKALASHALERLKASPRRRRT